MLAAATNNVPSLPALALTALFSSDVDFVFIGSVTVNANVQVLRNGDVQERQFGAGYTSQNPATEWIESGAKSATVGDDYEVRMEQISNSGGGSFSGTLNTWQTINATRNWGVSMTDNSPNSHTWTGTMRIRRIGDPGSEVSAGVTLTVNIDI